MKKALGFIEFKTIPVGIEATDEMLKSGNVELVTSTPICPGKFITIISGDVGAVQSSVRTGEKVGGSYVVDSFMIANINEKVMPALTGTMPLPDVESLGMVETIDGISSILAADAAAKASNIDLLEIRIARGLGGKAYFIITGEVSSVKRAIQASIDVLKDTGSITSHTVIARPHKDIRSALA
ncbi:MAG: BMC domain-containing protein [Eubacteriaceae bacterium]